MTILNTAHSLNVNSSDLTMQASSFTDQHDDWNIGQKAAAVNIGSHNLFLYARGTDRKPGDPAVIIMQGLGSSITGWEAVQQHLSLFIRVFSYDRTGYGQSDISTETPSSTQIAHELDLLLQHAHIPPPFILVAHSWAGILSRELLALRAADVAGIVFVEANQEHTLEILDWRILSNSPVLQNVDRLTATVLLQSQKLTAAEWKIYQDTEATEKHQKQAALEFEQYQASFPVLAAKAQLQQVPLLLADRPVCAIRGDNGKDFQKLYEAGVALGNGNETERAAFRKMVEGWNTRDRELQKGNLGLTDIRLRHYFEVPNSGHNVQLTSPDSIVAGVNWVLETLEAGASDSCAKN